MTTDTLNASATSLENEPSGTARAVPDERRMSFLPALFGKRHIILGEVCVYAWMGQLCADYTGGYWEFFEVPTVDADGASAYAGAGYMVLKTDRRLRVQVDGNGFDGSMSAEAAGIVATLFALCELANSTEDERLTQHYHDLRDFAAGHAESALIYRAID